MTPPSELEQRVAGAQAVLLEWRGRPFVWGVHDCAGLATAAMTARGRETRLPEAGRYTSLAGARRALKRLGHANLAEAVDAHGLARIPPAAALPGDLVGLPGEGRMTALFMAVGNGRVFGFFEGRAQFGMPLAFDAAWRT